jgi:hypothetical protein
MLQLKGCRTHKPKIGGAMKRRRRLEITVEISELVIRRSKYQTPVWCAECSSPVQSVTPEEAAVLAGVNISTIDRWVKAGHLHFIKGARVHPLICLSSSPSLTDKGRNNHVNEHIIDHRNRD